MIENVQKLFKSTNVDELQDANFLEKTFIPCLGLNNENLNEQPKELESFFGGGLGLRIWQYPNQFSKYMSLLSKYAKNINSYMEIGCRFGGTFITHVEYINRFNSEFKKAIAVDIIECPPNLVDYMSISEKVQFIRINSCTKEFSEYISSEFFDLIFIDGDHSYEGVKNDAEITREKCNIQVFHDITSDPCPGVGKYWRELKAEHSKTFDFYEFSEQYESVSGNFLGLGVAVRKNWISI